MPYSIEIVHVEDFVRYNSRKVPNLQSARESLRAIGETCRSRGINRVLIDSRAVEVPLSMPELYFVASALVEVGFPRSVWVAILPRPDRFDRAEFAALCAENRGWNARPVRTYEEAMAWFGQTESLDQERGSSDESGTPLERGAAGPRRI